MYLNPANLDAVAYQTLSHCLKDKRNIPEQDILSIADPDATRRLRSLAKPPQHGMPLDQVLENSRAIFQHRIKINHPRFFGFISSPASDYSWLGDMLNTAYNSNGAAWMTGSGVSAIENSLIDWAAKQVGFPSTAGGIFLSGGSMANLTALTAARDNVLTFEERSRAVIYCSAQTHCSNTKALRILGFGDHQVCKIPVDSNNRIRADALATTVKQHKSEGKRPFCIMASCGTTNTGSIDPLFELSAICRKENMWLHVDGAYGASIVLSKSYKHLAQDLKYADSISWDFHKWMFQVYGCVLVLVRNKQHLRDSFATGGDYLQEAGDGSEEYPNFWNYGPEMSRPARGMKLWFSLQMLGLENIGEMIDHGIELANTAQKTLQSLPDWEITSSSQMGIVCFRYAPSGKTDAELDELNKQISKTAQDLNVAAPFTTQLKGRTTLRMCAINPELSLDEMIQIVESLDAIAQDHAESLFPETETPPTYESVIEGELKTPVIVIDVKEIEYSSDEEDAAVEDRYLIYRAAIAA